MLCACGQVVWHLWSSAPHVLFTCEAGVRQAPRGPAMWRFVETTQMLQARSLVGVTQTRCYWLRDKILMRGA